ncbi:hypothetical protein JFL43_02055 [Viridibacillus sp. YIM B01967]|uniref:N-acetyltransferase domain-containing protein n=1 Tax=Viridibacillus soli TaxID=2798301 RepID=A0ABS1H2P6_9BACL|nr:hypothetical protein [Viridibacillus soli]MBK3493665.1 hypothetical protein [Viridibacillus soli]
MTVQIQQPKDIPLLTVFLEMMNNQQEHHIGFCSLERHTIHSKLTYFFSDLTLEESFIVAYDEGEIIGALGFDIYSTLNKAKVCGPFVKYPDKYPQLVEEMWFALNRNVPASLQSFEFLVNTNNYSIRKFLLKLQAIEVKRMIMIKALKNFVSTFNRDHSTKIHSNVHPFHKSFCQLLQIDEEQWFQFAATLNEDQKLLFYINEIEDILGYVYVRVEAMYFLGEIHHYTFLDLPNEKRAQLIYESLQHIFSYPQFTQTEMYLDKAEQLDVFTDAGFQVGDEMIYYQYKKTT